MLLQSSIVEILTLSSLGKIFNRRHIEIFFSDFFPQKTGFDISCKLSPMETICMYCQTPFSRKDKKNTTNVFSAALAQGGGIFFLIFPQKTGFDISCKLSGDNLHVMTNSVF